MQNNNFMLRYYGISGDFPHIASGPQTHLFNLG